VTLVVGPVAVGAALLSPEIVRVVLGQRWSSAIVPFQILALAILFRATASIGDALAAAIGAVYRRLLRRCIISSAIFAFCWIGSRWGLPGVAAGDLAALLLDFLIMAQMSLKATSVSWTDFVREQRPAIVLSVYTAVVASLAANGARMLHLPDVLTLAGAFTAVLITAVPLCIFLPRVFLGHHGEWMKSLLKEHLSRRKRRPAGDGAVPAAGAAS
jgi:PST family polysaccharide transporter